MRPEHVRVLVYQWTLYSEERLTRQITAEFNINSVDIYSSINSSAHFRVIPWLPTLLDDLENGI